MIPKLANYRTKVLITSKLEPLLMGGQFWDCRLRGIWGFGESEWGMCIYPGANHYPMPVPKESRELAIQISNLVGHFFAQKEDSRWLIDFDDAKNELVYNKTMLVTNASERGCGEFGVTTCIT